MANITTVQADGKRLTVGKTYEAYVVALADCFNLRVEKVNVTVLIDSEGIVFKSGRTHYYPDRLYFTKAAAKKAIEKTSKTVRLRLDTDAQRERESLETKFTNQTAKLEQQILKIKKELKL
jgi:hypothetical protein